MCDLFPATDYHLGPRRPLEDIPQPAVEVGDVVGNIEEVQEGQVPVGLFVLDDGVDADYFVALDGGQESIEAYPGEDVFIAVLVSWIMNVKISRNAFTAKPLKPEASRPFYKMSKFLRIDGLLALSFVHNHAMSFAMA